MKTHLFLLKNSQANSSRYFYCYMRTCFFDSKQSQIEDSKKHNYLINFKCIHFFKVENMQVLQFTIVIYKYQNLDKQFTSA